MTDYWRSPVGVLRRARDKANPYKTAAARDAFCGGWVDAANHREFPGASWGNNAYSKGWNARIKYEREGRPGRS